jgi:tetratricopeptide (TPR) repeat protein
MLLIRRTVPIVLCFAVFSTLGYWAPALWTSTHNRLAEPHFEGLGQYTRAVTTSSGEAYKYFNEGLAFLYAFNHMQALRSFAAAAQADSTCPMAYWGIAMACGPHINNMDVLPEDATVAWKAVLKACALAPNADPVEQALIKAVSARYTRDPFNDRGSLNRAYAEAMRTVWKAYPNDPDVGALTAEAILDLHPWDQWSAAGEPKVDTDEVIHVLTTVLRDCPSHPFALHLFIHTMEASPHPEDADVQANILRDLAPSLEHLVHMPSHIDVRRGRWHQAVEANRRAIAAEESYEALATSHEYRIWTSHNYHMLAYAAMMEGDHKTAFDASRKMLNAIPQAYVDEHAHEIAFLLETPYEIHLRFGEWEAMLEEPRPACATLRCLWHFARGVAYAAEKEVEKARAEQEALLSSRKAISDDAKLRNASAKSVIDLANAMLLGEILYREGKSEAAIAKLTEAIDLEDRLLYTDPPLWPVPVRHALGAVLMDAGRFGEAEIVYREDLRRHPDNGWALYGLARSLKMQGKSAASATVVVSFNEAWKYADFKISSSCCCLPHKE